MSLLPATPASRAELFDQAFTDVRSMLIAYLRDEGLAREIAHRPLNDTVLNRLLSERAERDLALSAADDLWSELENLRDTWELLPMSGLIQEYIETYEHARGIGV